MGTARQGRTPRHATSVDPDTFREALGQFATGVTVVTTLGRNGKPYGTTISSFSSLSLDPALVLWSLRCAAWSHSIYERAEHFAVNILSADQADVCTLFCSPDVDRFAHVETCRGIAGLPLIADCLAWIECRVSQQLPGGDHTIFIGEVLKCTICDKAPLVYWRGGFLPTHGSGY